MTLIEPKQVSANFLSHHSANTTTYSELANEIKLISLDEMLGSSSLSTFQEASAKTVAVTLSGEAHQLSQKNQTSY